MRHSERAGVIFLSRRVPVAILRTAPAGMTLWRKLRPFLPPLAWAATVWLIGGVETVPHGPVPTGLDKVAHFVMYGVLGWLCGRAWLSVGGRGQAVLLIALALALGAGDEWRQTRLSARSGERADWYADAAGVLAGFLFAVRRGRQQQRT